MTQEKNLWKWLAKAREHHPRTMVLERIENGVIDGMPDVFGCLNGSVFWIELKTAKLPARESTKVRVKFQPGQIPWITDYAIAGGKAFVLLQVGSGRNADRLLIPQRWLNAVEQGQTISVLRNMTICEDYKDKILSPTYNQIVAFAAAY